MSDEEIYYSLQSKVLAIVPKVPAILSIMGSSYIIYNIVYVQNIRANRRSENGGSGGSASRNRLYHQLMVALSVSDIIASHIYFLGTFLIPRGSGGPFGWVYWAFGTDATCSYSGFFNQFAVASPLYNTMLSIYFLLKIRYHWSETQLCESCYIKYIFHGVPLLFAMGTSFFALLRQPDTLYGNVFWTCWINPDPPQPDFRWFQWSFLFAPIWICVFLQTIFMAMLWFTVRGVEEVAKRVEDKDAANGNDNNKGTNTITTASSSGAGSKPNMGSSRSNVNSTSSQKKKHSNTEDASFSESEDEEKHQEQPRSKKLTVRDGDDDYYSSDEDDNGNANGDNGENKDASAALAAGLALEAIDPETAAAVQAMAILNERTKKIQHSKMIATQGMLYVGAFYITWFFPTLQRILEVSGIQPHFVFQALDTSLLPLQGLFNVLIYIRPKYVFYRRKYPDLPIMSVLKIVHNRTNEGTVIEKYTTKLIQQRKSQTNNRTNNKNNTNNTNNSNDNYHTQNNYLPTINEASYGSGTVGNSKSRGRMSSSALDDELFGSSCEVVKPTTVTTSMNNNSQNSGNSNNNIVNNNRNASNISSINSLNSETSSTGPRATSIRMDGSFWHAAPPTEDE